MKLTQIFEACNKTIKTVSHAKGDKVVVVTDNGDRYELTRQEIGDKLPAPGEDVTKYGVTLVTEVRVPTSIGPDPDAESVKSRAVDLKLYLDRLKKTADFEEKKQIARAMSSAFKAGGKEKFLRSLERVRTPAEVDVLAYNAALKGEGHGVL